MKITKSLWVVAVFALLAGQVGAQVISINFSHWATTNVNLVADGPGQGVLDDSGTIGAWNNIERTGTAADLIDSDGNVTAVSVVVGANASYFNQVETHWTVLNDYIYINGGSATNIATQPIVFSNLTAGATYDIAFMSQGNNLGQDAQFTIGGISTIVDPVNLQASEWTESENYALFFDVVANADGVITGEWSNVSAQYAGLGGIQIEKISSDPVEVPTPIMAYGGVSQGEMIIEAGNLLETISYDVQGALSLLGDPIDWTTLQTTSGVTSADFILPMTESNQFFRIKANTP